MKARLILYLSLIAFCCEGQDSLVVPRTSLFYGMSNGDSLVFYQCRVIDPEKEPKLAADYAQAPSIAHTLTDKMVVIKSVSGYSARVYKTHMRDLPNRKFSGLKVRERPYWMFEFVKSGRVSEAAMKVLLSTESKGREAIEYDYAITKHTRNQVIIKRGKNFKQLLPPSNRRLVELVE